MTRFKVFYSATSGGELAGGQRIVLGIATLTESCPGVRRSQMRFKASENEDATAWFEEMKPWIPFRQIVDRLVKSLGYDGKFFSSWDEDTGIGVDRI